MWSGILCGYFSRISMVLGEGLNCSLLENERIHEIPGAGMTKCI